MLVEKHKGKFKNLNQIEELQMILQVLKSKLETLQ